MVAVGNDGLWKAFASAIERDDLLRKERFATNSARVENRDVLIPLIQDIMLLEMQHPTAGTVNTLDCPIRLNRTPASVRMRPPLLGQQTDEILLGLGYDASDIAALHAKGAVE